MKSWIVWLTKVTVNSVDDDGDTTKLKTFNSAKLLTLLNTLNNVCNKLLDCDPGLDRSLKFKRAVTVAAVFYIEYMKHIRRQAKQTALYLKLLAVLILNPLQAHLEIKGKRKKEKNKENVEEESILQKPKKEVEEERLLEERTEMQ
jgi:hypothetical protein